MGKNTPLSEETTEEYAKLTGDLDKVGWSSAGGINLFTGETTLGAYLASELRTISPEEVAQNIGFTDLNTANLAGYDIRQLHEEFFDGIEVGYEGPLDATHIRVLGRLAYCGVPYEEDEVV